MQKNAIYVCFQQRNPKPNTLDKFLIEAMKTSCEQTIAAKTQMKAAKKEELQRIKLRVFVDGPSIDIDNSEVRHNLGKQSLTT